LGVQGLFSKPNKDRVGFVVNISHARHLLTSLVHICLIDADGVYPKYSLSFLSRHKGIPLTMEEHPKVSGDSELFAIDLNCKLILGIAPNI